MSDLLAERAAFFFFMEYDFYLKEQLTNYNSALGHVEAIFKN